MTIGTSNQTKVSIIKETVAGVTPSTPAMQLLRFTGETMQASNSTTVSEEIRDDRMTADLILTDQSVSGDLSGELSGLTYDLLFEGVLFADTTWTVAQAVAKTTVASTVSGFTDSSNGFITDCHLQVGQYFQVSGFGNPLVNIIYKVTTLAAGVIGTYPVPAAAISAGPSVFLKGSTIKNGKTDHSYSIQKTFGDTTVPSYINFKGVRFSTLKLDLAVGAIAKLTFGMMGLSGAPTETQIAGLTETARTSTSVMNCVTNVTGIVAHGTGLTTKLYFTDISMSYDNKLRELKAVGTLGNIDVRAGTIEAKASLNPYFENIELMQAFLANNSFELAVEMQSSDGYGYVISYPAVKFTTQTVEAGAKDQDLMVKGDVQAIIDASSLSMCRIDRFQP